MEKSENINKNDCPAIDTEKTNDSISGKEVNKKNLSTEALTWTDDVYRTESEDSSVDYSTSNLFQEGDDYYEAKNYANLHREDAVSNYHRLHKHHFHNLLEQPLGRYSKLTEINYSLKGLPFTSDHINLFPNNASSVSTEEKLGGLRCTRQKKKENKHKKVMFEPSPSLSSTNNNNVADDENYQGNFLYYDKFSYEFFEEDDDTGVYVPKKDMEKKDSSATSTKKRKFSTLGKDFENQNVLTEALTSTSQFEWDKEKDSNGTTEAFPTLKYRNATKEPDTTMNYSQLSELSQTSQFQNNTNNVGSCIREVETNDDGESEQLRNYVLTQYSNSGSEEGSRAININNIVDEI